ncbi:uncharacterized protein A1O5_09452 [Cladophialophora psammophila CBS 110553]|uniref:Xaa-Pro dipeptidyl-peptidase C-terminal domain-containing protein n=1 Tax=Cladophialophora psammophila CBS 110553 TaxID=1182543 RepID=W9XAH7_9EURO|nr:uncharacterized protein A1O5_09452 [Cladophialophora psammophila CBS 110553]EXJ67439.1 hypothetical protein A1O5_09452 [Cladophialophora psammophila CBS 110553]
MASSRGVFSVGGIEVAQTKISPIDDPHANYNGLNPSSTTLPKGHKKDPSRRGFEVATIWDRDVEVPMRDGIVLRADVFRPADVNEKVPALIAWSPYGKSGTGKSPCGHVAAKLLSGANHSLVSHSRAGFLGLDLVPGRVGIPKSMLSGFESFEAPDPAEWTAHGYAVVNVDARGIFKSEGNQRWNGTAEGRDGYDAVEFIASLPWCNGHVALIGVSWLAMAQWHIAAERPPHLSCILPLEGLSDMYRESLCRGGVPYLPFWHFLRDHGLYGLHTVGSIRGFEDIPHNKKWLRLHPTQEWHDLYQKETTDDLKKYLDFYTRGIKNDWEKTPKVRISVIRYNQPPTKNVPFSTWPIPQTEYKTLWLSGGQSLKDIYSTAETGEVSYQSDAPAEQVDNDPEFVEFTYSFAEKSTIIGPSKAVLYMSCTDHDDMDIFVIIRKADKNGKILQNINIPLNELGVTSEQEVQDINSLKYIGPSGILRASHRALDPKLSKPHWLAHDHRQEQKIPPGHIVKLEIGIWPAAIQFEAGEKLVFRVAGHQMTLAEFTPLRGQFHTGNKGKHTLHFGGQYDSHLVVSFVPI